MANNTVYRTKKHVTYKYNGKYIIVKYRKFLTVHENMSIFINLNPSETF